MLDLEKAGENQIPRVAMESGNMAFVAAALLLEIVSAQNFDFFSKISITSGCLIIIQPIHCNNDYYTVINFKFDLVRKYTLFYFDTPY